MNHVEREGIHPDAVHAKCGEWWLLREIGRGAYGVVYLAENAENLDAAVKICRRDSIDDERYERELRGARLYMSVSASEGLVRLHEVVEEDWGFYSVMDLADDEFGERGRPINVATYRPKTLGKVIEGEKALPLKECVKLGITLAEGLATLQRHHLLHRDIKPGNVIYVGGKPVLSDPGLLIEETEAKSLVGTPGYIPPEKFQGAESDIYSLGLTLKAASFGRRIEELDKGPAQEADVSAATFPVWWRILNKATDAIPSRRYHSAKALLKDLERLRRKIAITSVFGSRVAKVAIALAVLAAVAAIVFAVVTSRRATEEIVRRSGENKALSEEVARLSAGNEAGLLRIYERAFRDSFEDLPEEVIKFMAQKSVAGETFTNAEIIALTKKIEEAKTTNQLDKVTK